MIRGICLTVEQADAVGRALYFEGEQVAAQVLLDLMPDRCAARLRAQWVADGTFHPEPDRATLVAAGILRS